MPRHRTLRHWSDLSDTTLSEWTMPRWVNRDILVTGTDCGFHLTFSHWRL